jgi:peptidyl-prolyl cis-trans isomerase C
LAYAELLRQQAVREGLLPAHPGLNAPELSDAQRAVIETMVDQAAASPQPTADECRRYFEAHKSKFVLGQSLHVRHILFAVTPGVNVQALAVHAENALLSLIGNQVPETRFATLAAQLSNCPSRSLGGDLGWLAPGDCAPELARELFHQTHSARGLGVQTRLFQTRFGFHIIELLARREGQQLSFDDVSARVATQLATQSRTKALQQYMRLLVGQAKVDGLALGLEGADSPLLQ